MQPFLFQLHQNDSEAKIYNTKLIVCLSSSSSFDWGLWPVVSELASLLLRP